MSILEMQGMRPQRGEGGGHGGGGSDVSLLLCDSMVSFILCL